MRSWSVGASSADRWRKTSAAKVHMEMLLQFNNNKFNFPTKRLEFHPSGKICRHLRKLPRCFASAVETMVGPPSPLVFFSWGPTYQKEVHK